MAVTAPPIPGFAFAALARWAETLPQAAAAGSKIAGGAAPRQSDLVVFSSLAPMRLLADLASTGLQKLVSLLPLLEHALRETASEPQPVPLGHFAKALGAAAREMDQGHEALLTFDAAEAAPPREDLRLAARQLGTPASAPRADSPAQQILRETAREIGALRDGPTMTAPDHAATSAERWLGDAKAALHDAADVLARAEQRLSPAAQLTPQLPAGPDTMWALSQIAFAQRQVAITLGSVTTSRLRTARSFAPAAIAAPTSLAWFNGAVAGFGAVLFTLILVVAAGSWSLLSATAVMALAGAATLVWAWRFIVASRGFGLQGRR